MSEFSKVKSKTLKHSPGKEESSGSLSETVCKRELRSQETPEKNRSLLETPLRPSAPLKGPGGQPKEKGFFSELEDLPYLSTTEMYLCRWHQPPPSPLPLREPSPKKEETVASKRWRERRRRMRMRRACPVLLRCHRGVLAQPAARGGLRAHPPPFWVPCPKTKSQTRWEMKPVVPGPPQAPPARAVLGALQGVLALLGPVPFPPPCFLEPPPRACFFKPSTKQLPSPGWETRSWLQVVAVPCGVWAENLVPLLPGRLFLGFSSKPHGTAPFFWGFLLRSS